MAKEAATRAAHNIRCALTHLYSLFVLRNTGACVDGVGLCSGRGVNCSPCVGWIVMAVERTSGAEVGASFDQVPAHMLCLYH